MKKGFLLLALMTSLGVSAQKQWTLDDCINYAMQHNIDLQQVRLTQKSATEDVKQSKAALLPTLSASTNQSVNYDPWDEFSTDKVSYNGTYTINAQWTVWNGGQNTNQLKLNKLREKDSNLTLLESSNSVQEAIAKLYVQILYQKEAIEVRTRNAASRWLKSVRCRKPTLPSLLPSVLPANTTSWRQRLSCRTISYS